ncbi:homocysteine S-methyltransferase [Liquorilactobacillus capillatus]|uniref:S-methylmethionine:homocysteine methyltransferase n=1 Tax=Liquorilactobacillus capillatus DSM 19910 TaxID=1423731 RepID=A0A0R1M6Z9_9LACO|nr:homocysteine S-methyltransferase [Liquorilactobacillus capillatus]KRL00570.1 homocysteine S-methyltransferase [Liquorilactobacillus capillatus DSM 19910]
MPDLIAENLKKMDAIVIDGAMATELEKRGVDTNSSLWSAAALLKEPEKVTAVHQSFFEAGADVVITDTYQANIAAFEKMGLTRSQSEKLIVQAVRCAQTARTAFYSSLTPEERAKRATYPLVAGSVGPYGAYLADGSEYTGSYLLTEEEYYTFHYSRLKLLAQAGVDLFAFETQPNFNEVKALVHLLVDRFPKNTAWVSFSVKDSTHLCDGTPLVQAVKYLESYQQVTAIGVNCLALEKVAAVVETIKQVTAKPLIVYPNNGDRYNPQTKTWQTNVQTVTFNQIVPKLQQAGVRLIGGCCRTTPADISEIAKTLKQR